MAFGFVEDFKMRVPKVKRSRKSDYSSAEDASVRASQEDAILA